MSWDTRLWKIEIRHHYFNRTRECDRGRLTELIVTALSYTVFVQRHIICNVLSPFVPCNILWLTACTWVKKIAILLNELQSRHTVINFYKVYVSDLGAGNTESGMTVADNAIEGLPEFHCQGSIQSSSRRSHEDNASKCQSALPCTLSSESGNNSGFIFTTYYICLAVLLTAIASWPSIRHARLVTM